MCLLDKRQCQNAPLIHNGFLTGVLEGFLYRGLRPVDNFIPSENLTGVEQLKRSTLVEFIETQSFQELCELRQRRVACANALSSLMRSPLGAINRRLFGIMPVASFQMLANLGDAIYWFGCIVPAVILAPFRF